MATNLIVQPKPVETVPLLQPGLESGPTVVEQYLRALRRHRWVALAILVSFLALGLAITLLTTPVYTATSRIEINRTSDNVTNVEGLQDESSSDSLEFYQTQYSLLESRSLAERVMRSLNLAQDQTFLNAAGIDPDVIEVDPTRDLQSLIEEEVIDHLLREVSIQPIRGSSLVDISFTSPDRALSQRIANSWTEQFIQSNLDRRFASTEDAREFLEEQLEVLRQRLEQSEAELVAYASDKRIIALRTQENSSGNTRTEQTLAANDLEILNASLAAATAERIAALSELGAASGVSDNALANSAINGLRQERGQIQSEFARVNALFGSDYPQVIALRDQIEALDRAIAREEQRVRSAVSTRYQEAVSRENSLRARVEALKNQLIGQRRDSIQYTIYQREVDTNRQLYDALLQRYKEIGVAGVGSNNILVVDRAQYPQDPSSPSLPFNLAVSLLLGLGAATMAVALLEYLDQKFKDPQELNAKLGLPLLGSVPWVEDGDVFDALEDRKSAASEAYLTVKTNLSFVTDHGVPKTFMITSTAENEGKSVSALALARTLARTGAKVLVVDGDIRNPSIGTLLGYRSEIGLSNYLSGQHGFGGLAKATEFENLWMLDSGPNPPNAAELLSGPALRQLITEASREFDHVIVDAPPVLGIADAPLISAAVEGVVYTVESDRHKLRGIASALQRLRAANANLLGGFVTKLDEQDASYGYGYGYGVDGPNRPVLAVNG